MNCLVYRINNSLYAVDAGEVVGVENSLNINSLPGQPGGIVGFADIRGRMTPVVSVRRFFGLPVVKEGTTLVVNDGESQIAYLTDGVEAIREIDFNAANSAPLIIKGFAECVKNMTLVDGNPVIYMELADILPESERTVINAFLKQFESKKEDDSDNEKAAEAAETEASGGEA